MSQTEFNQDKGSKESIEILLRQINTCITRDSSGTQLTGPTVPYSKLYSLASKSDKTLMYIGWVCAAVTGLGMPSFVFLIGDVINSFDGVNTSPTAMLDKIKILAIAFSCIGVFIYIVSYIYFSFLLMSSERIIKKTRTAYVEAILKQESAWFDTNNPSELNARIGKECLAMQKALGEKMGTILLAFAMTLTGLTFAFIKGWSFSLVILGAFPFIAFATTMMNKVLQKGFKENMKAYGQSAGYAEQALNAIRVVVAYGQEKREVANYQKYLDRAKQAGIKTHLKGALVMAMFFSFIFGTYAYSFFMGSVWIYNDIRNTTYDRPYRAGEVLSCFFGVIFGMFSIGMATPNMKAVIEGRTAGKMAFDIIDRKPAIDQDDPNGKEIQNLKGSIEFKNVSFYYPSRPDTQILKNFSAKFEVGKTTAIVGPSGSGKSTVVQLIERFYDPIDGQVLVDGQDLKTLKLRQFRQQVGYVGQEPVLFNTTIKENILMGKSDATDDEIITALKKANAYDFLLKHEAGINLHVGASGGQMSGGQKQRLAIARAFIKQPKVLIFDEATSALDKKNEADVQKSIDTIRAELGQITTIVIAHRLSTIRTADTILVMKKGKIVETGNHDSLLREHPNGIYAKLVKQQEEAENNEQDTDPNEIEYTEKSENGDNLEEGRKVHNTSYSKYQKFSNSPIKPTNKVQQEQLTEYKSDQKDTKEDDLPQPMRKVSQKKPSVAPTKPAFGKKQKDPLRLEEEKRMKELADSIDAEVEKKDAEFMKVLEKKNFMGRLQPYNKPCINVFIGMIASCAQGCIFPTFGCFMAKVLFAYMNPDKEIMQEQAREWVLYMFIAALVSLCTAFTQKFSFGVVGENITLNVRHTLYGSIVKKAIGWFDSRDNSAGVLTSVLASEAQVLNGASTEGLAIILESAFAMCCGITIGFCFTWRLSLVALGCMPLQAIGGSINAKIHAGMANHDEQAYRNANLLAGDAIMNYRTVASLANDKAIVKTYDNYIDAPARAAIKKSHCIGFWFGFSQFCQNAVSALLFYAGAEFVFHFPQANDGEDIFKAQFAMMFGAFAAGQAQQFGPDMGKAKKAAIKIFSYIDQPSKIDAVDIQQEAVSINKETFRGKIEFRDVWFRYPSRKNEWVFKGLNLIINPNESVACVGESGSGKSTMVNLILRFYDPDFGTVLIDDIDVKEYNLQELRKRMGLVMQEPTLFNYTIQENILYGEDRAFNTDIQEAASIANALEFIESSQLSMAYEDSASALLTALRDNKPLVLEQIDEEKFKEYEAVLSKLVIKEQEDGKFQAMKGEIDDREDKYRDITLNPGFEIQCGLKGGKLSGGQKQRVAIARAVIRKPNILILDEATSALDEESQRKVQVALDNIMEGRTSIVIAHRLTTVEKCSRVIVIEDGRVVEEGKFNELKNAQDGYFAHIAEGMKKAEQKKTK